MSNDYFQPMSWWKRLMYGYRRCKYCKRIPETIYHENGFNHHCKDCKPMKKIKPKPYALLLQQGHKFSKWDTMLTRNDDIVIVLDLKPVPGTSMTQTTVYPWNPQNGWLRLQWLKLKVFFNCL